jgi:lysophospholipase L1-like esterase
MDIFINGLKYVDVTEISKRTLNESNLLASDNLHPSGLMYLEWAKKIYETWID